MTVVVFIDLDIFIMESCIVFNESSCCCERLLTNKTMGKGTSVSVSRVKMMPQRSWVSVRFWTYLTLEVSLVQMGLF